jgi:hypothetical protein
MQYRRAFRAVAVDPLAADAGAVHWQDLEHYDSAAFGRRFRS